MGASARLGLPWPNNSDAASGPAAFQALAEALDPLTPDVNEAAALAGTSGAPAAGNKYVTNADARLADQRVPTDGSVTNSKVASGAAIAPNKIAGTAIIEGDARLTNARTPTAHAASHQEGGSDDTGAPPIGTVIAYAGSVLPAGNKWDWADGGLIDRTTFATFYGRVGHAYNGGADPGANKVRKPDKRGRVSVGADNFGAGAAGRIPNSNRLLGQWGGEERHQLVYQEIPSSVYGNMPGTHQGYDAYDSFEFSAGQAQGVNNNSAGGGAHNIMQPYECDTYLVRVA